MMMLDEYVEARIHAIFADLAKDVANGTVHWSVAFVHATGWSRNRWTWLWRR